MASGVALAAFFLCLAVPSRTTNSLKQLHVIFRHGERTPASTYPNDPYINEKFLPYGWGHLTNVGKINPYKQGQWLRENYGDFIGEYSSQTVEVHSTEVYRAQMTAGAFCAGLFPPIGDQIWNKDLLWQPVPLKIQPLKNDRLLLTRGCPKFNQLLSEVLESKEVKDSVLKNKELYDYLTEKSGTNVRNPYDVEDIYSTLKAEEGINLKLPEWTKTVYPSQMEKESARIFTLNTYNNDLIRLKGGPLLKKILNDCQSKMDGKDDYKLKVYSGHDATVANLLRALGTWEEQMPAYNAMAIFELHQGDPDFILKVKLRNSSTHDPYDQKIPGCPDPCNLTKVQELMAPRLPEDLDKECQVTDDGSLEVMPDAVQP
uniref:acid phosphatase n=2 Tax=Lygus hesperus TaxID=30085 RepID=A0A0A9XGP6_LYGHE